MHVKTSTTLYRLLGVVALVLAIQQLPGIINLALIDYDFAENFNIPLFVAAAVGPFTLLAMLGIWLTLRRPREEATSSTAVGGSALDAEQINTGLLLASGLFLIGFAASDIVPAASDLAYYLANEPIENLSTHTGILAWSSLVGALIPLILGLLLVFKSAGFASMIQRMSQRASAVAADAQCPHCGYWIVTAEYEPNALGYRCGKCEEDLPRSLIEEASAPAPDAA